MNDAYNAGRAAGIREAAEVAAQFVHNRLYKPDMPACSYHSREVTAAILALLDAPAPAGVTVQVSAPSLSFLRPIWKAHGGEWHGPKVERWSIPEAQMTAFFNAALRALSGDRT